jgi:hypothetical protein
MIRQTIRRALKQLAPPALVMCWVLGGCAASRPVSVMTPARVTPDMLRAAQALAERIAQAAPGETLVVPAGTYVFERGLPIDDRRDLTIVFQRGAEVCCSDSLDDVLQISGCTNLRLAGGVFRRLSGENGVPGQGTIVQAVGTRDLLLYRCNLSGGVIGLCADQCTGLTIDRCTVRENAQAAFALTRCADVEIMHSTIEQNGCLFNYSDIESLTMYGNELVANDGYWEGLYREQRPQPELDRQIDGR